jgi:Ring finger domain
VTNTLGCVATEAQAAAEAAQYSINSTQTCRVNPSSVTDITLNPDLAAIPSSQRSRLLVISVLTMLLATAASLYLIYFITRVLFAPRSPRVPPTPRSQRRRSSLAPDGVFRGSRAARCLTPQEAERTLSPLAPLLAVDASSPEAAAGTDARDKERLCVVCLDDLDLAAEDPDDRAVALPCRHTFHTGCIMNWLTTGGGLCPCCNLDLRPLVRPGYVQSADASAEDDDSDLDSDATTVYSGASQHNPQSDQFVVIPLDATVENLTGTAQAAPADIQPRFRGANSSSVPIGHGGPLV